MKFKVGDRVTINREGSQDHGKLCEITNFFDPVYSLVGQNLNCFDWTEEFLKLVEPSPTINTKKESCCPPHDYKYQLLQDPFGHRRILYCSKCGDIKDVKNNY